MMRVAVTGAGGFLGRAACRALDDAGHDVLMIDQAIRPVSDGGSWTALDLVAASPSEIRDLLADLGVDVVVNCAGVVNGDRRRLMDGNVRLVLNLIEAITAMSVPPRLVQIGSAAEYGDCTPGAPTGECDRPRPASPYAQTKLLATDLVMTAVTTRRLDGVVLRVFNPVGPGAPPHTVVGAAVRKLRDALAAGAPLVMGPLSAMRDFVDIRDVGRAIAAACVVPNACGLILNVGRGHATVTRTLVTSLMRAAGFTGRLEEHADGSARSSAVAWQEADVSRIDEILGWRPQIGMDQSMADLWACATAGELAVR